MTMMNTDDNHARRRQLEPCLTAPAAARARRPPRPDSDSKSQSAGHRDAGGTRRDCHGYRDRHSSGPPRRSGPTVAVSVTRRASDRRTVTAVTCGRCGRGGLGRGGLGRRPRISLVLGPKQPRIGSGRHLLLEAAATSRQLTPPARQTV
jgi:hypothetical protein